MPGMCSGHEKLSYMKYQIVMNLSLLCDRHWVEAVSPVFAVICQYLSSTVRDLAPFTFSPWRREILGIRHLHEGNNLWKQLLSVRRLG